MDAPYVWDHISEGKVCIKNPKTCGPSKWPPLTTGMSYSCGPSVSIEKPRDKRLAYKLVDKLKQKERNIKHSAFLGPINLQNVIWHDTTGKDRYYRAVHTRAAHIGGSIYLFDKPHEKLLILKLLLKTNERITFLCGSVVSLGRSVEIPFLFSL